MRHLTTRAAGLLILIGGIWGGLIPFVGPYFHFTLGPDTTWTWTSSRFVLHVLPGAAAVVGGLILLRSGPRLGGRFGAILGLAAGIWFVVGPDVSRFWHAGGAAGAGTGGNARQALESLTFHSGLGVVMAALAAYALPGLLLRRRVAEAEGAAAGAAAGRGAVRRDRVATSRPGPGADVREPAVEPVPAAAGRDGVAADGRREGLLTNGGREGVPADGEHERLATERERVSTERQGIAAGEQLRTADGEPLYTADGQPARARS